MPIHTFTQQAARFADVHGITGCAGDGVHNRVGGAASELSLWAWKRDNASLLDQRAGFAPGRIAEKGGSCFAAVPLLWSGSNQQVHQVQRPAIVCRELVFIWIYQTSIQSVIQDYDSCEFFFGKIKKRKTTLILKKNEKCIC